MCENLNYHVQRFQNWYLYTKQAANLGCPFESLYLEKKIPMHLDARKPVLGFSYQHQQISACTTEKYSEPL